MRQRMTGSDRVNMQHKESCHCMEQKNMSHTNGFKTFE